MIKQNFSSNKILVTGSESYIGTYLLPYLHSLGLEVTGLDAGLITDCLLYPTTPTRIIYKDTRAIKESDLKPFNTVVYLAGISNDPFKSFNPKKIYDPVRSHTIRTAKLCKKLGIKFIFSSSCSIYGKGTDNLMDEESNVFPQTPYSINKLQIEQDLTKLAGKSFVPIIFRFATVFGLSPRMRFDLVVNMFTAMAFTRKSITLNSNGKAWRPLVHVSDVCKAIKYAIDFKASGHKPIILNVGSSNSNYQIITLAEIVKREIPGVKIKFLNQGGKSKDLELIKDRKIQDGVDSRDYKISFEKISKVFPGFKCDFSIERGVREMVSKFKEINLSKTDFENINYYRLQKLESLIQKGLLSSDLKWLKKIDRNNSPINIETERLHLRLFRETDVTKPYVRALNSKKIIGLTESRYRKWNESEVREYIKNKGNIPGESLLIGIFIKGKEKHIGNIRLHTFSTFNKRVEMGILIWDKKEWGKSYAKEAIKAVCDYAFYVLGFNKVCAEYYSTNNASSKMFKKLGFEIEGIFKEHFIVEGEFIDAVRVAKYNHQ